MPVDARSPDSHVSHPNQGRFLVTAVRVLVAVDRDRCIGSGNCMYWAPATFDLDDEGVSVPIEPAPDPLEKLRVAADGCPTRAITVEVVDPTADTAPAAGEDGR